MRPWRWTLASLTAIVVLGVGDVLPVGAQDEGSSFATPSREPTVIKGQLRRASELGRRTLAGLRSAPDDDSVPLDESLHRGARQTYVLIRAARHGMTLIKEWNEGRKGVLPDPIMDLAYRRVDAAWNLSRTAVDGWGSSYGRQEYLRRSTEDLGQAMNLIDQALALMP